MIRRTLVAVSLALSLPAVASPLFDDPPRTPNLWLVEGETQELVPLSAGRWLDRFNENGQPVQALMTGQAGLVNGLPLSSTPMRPGQPAVSIAGLGEAAGSVGGAARPRAPLVITPGSGRYEQTVAIEVGLAASLFESRPQVRLRLTRNPGAVREVLLCGTSAQDCQRPQPLQDGRLGIREFAVANGRLEFTAELLTAQGQVEAQETRQYEIDADPRRDTDGDGIPDLIEAAIGLDPTRDDFDQDRDGDGWSDFDEWLRCPVAYDAEMRCPALDDPESSPQDRDNDGWSNLDEGWRGTSADDPEPELDSLSSADREFQRLRFKDRPSARRLYEREYQVLDFPLVPRSGAAGDFIRATAHLPDGTVVWSFDDRLDEETIRAADLEPDDLSVTVRLDVARQKLAEQRLPVARVPAGDGVVLEVWQSVGDHIQTYKRYLPPLPDADVRAYLATEPEWSTVQEFRNGLISWLVRELVWRRVPAAFPLDWTATRNVLALERVLTDEARLHDAPGPIVFNDSLPARGRPWLKGFVEALDQAGLEGGLAGLVERLDDALIPHGALADIREFIDRETDPQNMPVQQYSDLWLARRFDDASPELPAECTLTAAMLEVYDENPEALAELEARCAVLRTEDDVAAQELEDLQRRYALRSLLLHTPRELSGNRSLLDPDADSDGDGVTNYGELGRRPLVTATRPDVVDSDGDGVPDGQDPCPADPLDACLGNALWPRLQVPGTVQVREDAPGGVAVVVVFLDRPGRESAVIDYQALAGAGDTATAGADFVAVSGQLTLPPGATRGMVTVPVVHDHEAEPTETFTLRLRPISGLQGGVARDVRIEILDVAPPDDGEPPLPLPPRAVATAPESVASGEYVVLDAAGSEDPLGQGLSYRWQQLSGDEVALDNATAAEAGFLAPVVEAPQTLRFRLRVEDGEGREDTAEVSIEVSPRENLPPVLLREAFEASVFMFDTLRIEDEELLALVRDPEGGELFLAGLWEHTPGGEVQVEDGYMLFRPYPGAIPVMRDSHAPVRVLPVGHAQALVVLEHEQFGSSVVLYDADTGRSSAVLARTSEVLAVSGSTSIFLAGEGEDQAKHLLRRNVEALSEPAEDLGSYDALGLSDLSKARIDPSTGDLYYCRLDNAGQGYLARLSAGSTTPQSSPFVCEVDDSVNPALSVVARTQGYCFVAGPRLFCGITGNQVLRQMQTFAGEVQAIFVADHFFQGSRLQVVERGHGATPSLRLWTLSGLTGPGRLEVELRDAVLAPSEPMQSFNTGYLPVIGAPLSEQPELQLYRWPYAAVPERIIEPVPLGRSVIDYGGFAFNDAQGAVYWHRLDPGGSTVIGDDAPARLMELNVWDYDGTAQGGPVYATFRERAHHTVRIGGHRSSILHDGQGVVLQVGDSPDLGSCRLLRLRTDESRREERIHDAANCSNAALPLVLRRQNGNSTVLFEVQQHDRWQPMGYDGEALVDIEQPGQSAVSEFERTVYDNWEQGVALPIRITIKTGIPQ